MQQIKQKDPPTVYENALIAWGRGEEDKSYNKSDITPIYSSSAQSLLISEWKQHVEKQDHSAMGWLKGTGSFLWL